MRTMTGERNYALDLSTWKFDPPDKHAETLAGLSVDMPPQRPIEEVLDEMIKKIHATSGIDFVAALGPVDYHAGSPVSRAAHRRMHAQDRAAARKTQHSGAGNGTP